MKKKITIRLIYIFDNVLKVPCEFLCNVPRSIHIRGRMRSKQCKVFNIYQPVYVVAVHMVSSARKTAPQMQSQKQPWNIWTVKLNLDSFGLERPFFKNLISCVIIQWEKTSRQETCWRNTLLSLSGKLSTVFWNKLKIHVRILFYEVKMVVLYSFVRIFSTRIQGQED
jgi:hypothetical protein